MLNLDTHILVFALQGTLTRRENAVLSRHRWGISAIVLWEIAKLHQLGRITLGISNPLLSRALSGMEVWPLTQDVCLNLATLDFKSDPADELIAATSLTYQVPLMTRDARIRTSKLIKFA
jgi:PIN domain nuclease of toxin-antitoxin system